MPVHRRSVVSTKPFVWKTGSGDRERMPGSGCVAAGGGGEGRGPRAAHHGGARGCGHLLFLQQTWAGGCQPPLSDLGPDLISLVVCRHLNPGFTFTT